MYTENSFAHMQCMACNIWQPRCAMMIFELMCGVRCIAFVYSKKKKKHQKQRQNPLRITRELNEFPLHPLHHPSYYHHLASGHRPWPVNPFHFQSINAVFALVINITLHWQHIACYSKCTTNFIIFIEVIDVCLAPCNSTPCVSTYIYRQTVFY